MGIQPTTGALQVLLARLEHAGPYIVKQDGFFSLFKSKFFNVL